MENVVNMGSQISISWFQVLLVVAVATLADAYGPAPVHDTPEVAAAKAAHFSAVAHASGHAVAP